jgi:hypothetical protein
MGRVHEVMDERAQRHCSAPMTALPEVHDGIARVHDGMEAFDDAIERIDPGMRVSSKENSSCFQTLTAI